MSFDPAKTNAAFDNCYHESVVPAPEWQAFLECLRAPLPTTFSIVETGCNEVRPHLVEARLESLVLGLSEPSVTEMPTAGCCVASGSRTILRLVSTREGRVRALLRVEGVARPRSVRRLPWFPHGRGWQFDAPRKELAALRSTCRELRRFLEAHIELGRVNRQEAVSMLPPLLLRVRPGNAVLDMCAAPGSKTVLLLSQLSTRPQLAADRRDGTGEGEGEGRECALGSGCVVANEINPLRCNRLRVRMAKTRVLGAIVTCHPAQDMPEGATYDRVLCDVPCSGDGTLRKNPDIWRSWQPRFSASLHPLQLSIIRRGLQLLRPGG